MSIHIATWAIAAFYMSDSSLASMLASMDHAGIDLGIQMHTVGLDSFSEASAASEEAFRDVASPAAILHDL